MKIKSSFLILLIGIIGSIFLFAQIVMSANTDIIINEIGAYESAGYEWVEIWNKGNDAIILDGWKFVEDGTNHGLTASTTDNILSPGEYGAICQDENKFLEKYPSFAGSVFDSSWGSLKESGEEIGLKDSAGNWAEVLFVYPAVSNYSLERVSADVGASSSANWKEHPAGSTVGQINYWTNYVPPSNQPPIAIINGPTSTSVGETVEFDSSDSNDSDGTIVSHQWSVGGEEAGVLSIFSYQFATSGSFAIVLQVIDDKGASASTSLDIIVNSTATTAIITTSTTFPTIYINEFLSDPAAGTEWIELYNPSTSTVNLTGWTLSDSVGVRSSPTGTIDGEDFFVIELTNILNNTGDTITLKNPNVEVVDQVIYGIPALPAPAKSNSISRSVDGVGAWQETTTPTRDSANIITAPASPSASSGQRSGSVGSQTNQEIPPSNNLNSAGQIIINELLPNPKGSDTENEFIELKNIGTEQVNLQDWIIADASNRYKIKEGMVKPGGFIVYKRSTTNIALNNSGEETVKLSNPAGELIDSVKYSGPAGEDESYAKKSDGIYLWTIKLTPGAENIFVDKNLAPVVSVGYMKEAEVGETAIFDASDTYDPESDSLQFTWTTGSEERNGPVVDFVFERAGNRVVELTVDDGHGNREFKKLNVTVVRTEASDEADAEVKIDGSVAAAPAVKKSGKSYQPVVVTTLEKIGGMAIGDKVRVSGVVAVLPGVFGSQYFYIVDQTSGAGVQVYSNKKDFPNLKIGNKVEVTGELSQAYGEWRVKTKEKKDIKISGFAEEPIGRTADVADIDESMVGSLVTASGEITELKASNLYLDDGTDEIRIYFKKGAGLDKKNYRLGEMVKITGIVGMSSAGLQIIPRGGFDIEKMEETIASSGSVLGDKKSSGFAETYLTVTAGGLTSILIGLFARARGKLVFSILKKTGSLAVALIKRGPRV